MGINCDKTSQVCFCISSLLCRFSTSFHSLYHCDTNSPKFIKILQMFDFCIPQNQIGTATTATRHHTRLRHPDLVGVEVMTVLGVSITNTMSFAPHVMNGVDKTASSLYALKTLKAHGLCGQALCEVTQAVSAAQLLCASLSWSGFLKANEMNKLQMILNKAVRCGFLPLSCRAIDELFESSGDTLFSAILNNTDHVLYFHVLHFLLPPPKVTGHDLHKCSHGLTLTATQSSFVRKNCIRRMSYKDIY